MPITEVQGPDGSTYEIEHPEGATDEEIISYAQASFGQQAPAVPERNLSGAAMEGLSNVPTSAGNLVSDIYSAVTNPGQTLDSVNNLIGGYLQKGADTFGGDMITAGGEDKRQYADLMNEYMSGRYGGEQELLNTLATDPVGLTADIAGLLTGGGGLAAKVASTGSKVERAGQVASKVGNLIDPIQAGVKTAAFGVDTLRGGGAASRGLLGVTTGAGTKSIERAVEGSPEFKAALRKDIEPSQIVQVADNALKEFKSQRGIEYRKKLQELEQNYDIAPDGSIVMRQVDISNVYDTFDQKLADHKITRNADGSLNFSRSDIDLDTPAKATFTEIDNKLQDWGSSPQDLTPSGVDTLKRTFDKVFTESNGSYDTISALRSETRKALVDQVDGYAEMTADYQKATEFIDELEKTFSMQGTQDGKMRKLNQAVKDNFESRADLLESVDAELGTSLVDMIAGNQMSSWMARNMVGRFAGMAAAGFAVGSGISKEIIAGLLFSSPKVVANTLSTLGVPKSAAKRFIKQRPKLQKQYDAIMKSLEGGSDKLTTGARATIPAVRIDQATGEYQDLIQQEMNNGM